MRNAAALKGCLSVRDFAAPLIVQLGVNADFASAHGRVESSKLAASGPVRTAGNQLTGASQTPHRTKS
jgi:hypothetical protein